jgi:hypothetical protein
MKRKAILCALFVLSLFVPGVSIPVRADDSAASIAAGGLVPRRETRIVMAKEVLKIGLRKVVVDYDFRNDSDEDVVTEVAFPVPPYENDFAQGPALEQSSFKSFKLWVDGEPVHFELESKAMLKDKDITTLLNANQIDIPTFGHFVDTVDKSHNEVFKCPDYARLSQSAKDRLVKAGIFDRENAQWGWGKWTVHLQYHWLQVFPAHAIVHIRHEYAPVVGFTQVQSDAAEGLLTQQATGRLDKNQDEIRLLADFCADRSFLNSLMRKFRENKAHAVSENDRFMAGVGYPRWVDFILTTANTWQRPIEDFTLIVERPDSEKGEKTLISFCSPNGGKVEKLDVDHFQVHLTNFVPSAELHIGFFDLPGSASANRAGQR